MEIAELNGDLVVSVNERLQRKFENAQSNGSIVILLDDDNDGDNDDVDDCLFHRIGWEMEILYRTWSRIPNVGVLLNEGFCFLFLSLSC